VAVIAASIDDEVASDSVAVEVVLVISAEPVASVLAASVLVVSVLVASVLVASVLVVSELVASGMTLELEAESSREVTVPKSVPMAVIASPEMPLKYIHSEELALKEVPIHWVLAAQALRQSTMLEPFLLRRFLARAKILPI
jgi:hypothetical protein